MKIFIPKPCHENWDAMLPEQQGRFCLKCTKTVVDFSARSKEEIHDFFREATGKVCGRFSTEQVYKKPEPVPAMFYPKAQIRQFAWALYLVFGTVLFSCSDNSRTMGEPKVEHVKGDVVEVQDPPKMGKVKIEDKSAGRKKNKKDKKACAPAQSSTIMGDTITEIPIVGEVMLEE